MGTAIDYSGHGNHGEIRGGAKTVAGYVGGAIDFDGMNDFIYIGKTAAALGIQGRHAKSVTAWVYTRAFHDGGVFDMGARTNSQDFCLRVRTAANQWRVQYYGTGYDHDFTYTSQDRWVHFALVYDGDRSICYANGVSVSAADRVLGHVRNQPLPDRLLRLAGQLLRRSDRRRAAVRQGPDASGGPSDLLAGRSRAGMERQAVRGRPSPMHCWPSRSRGSRAMALSSTMSTSPPTRRDPRCRPSRIRREPTGAARTPTATCHPELEWNKRYYWRIDEVTATGDVVKGRIWDFTTTDWLIVDDFESYTNELAEPDVPDLARWLRLFGRRILHEGVRRQQHRRRHRPRHLVVGQHLPQRQHRRAGPPPRRRRSPCRCTTTTRSRPSIPRPKGTGRRHRIGRSRTSTA